MKRTLLTLLTILTAFNMPNFTTEASTKSVHIENKFTHNFEKDSNTKEFVRKFSGYRNKSIEDHYGVVDFSGAYVYGHLYFFPNQKSPSVVEVLSCANEKLSSVDISIKFVWFNKRDDGVLFESDFYKMRYIKEDLFEFIPSNPFSFLDNCKKLIDEKVKK